jgi:hypothetical protein
MKSQRSDIDNGNRPLPSAIRKGQEREHNQVAKGLLRENVSLSLPSTIKKGTGIGKETASTIKSMMSANDTHVSDVALSVPRLALTRSYQRWFLLKRHRKIPAALKTRDVGHDAFDYMLNSGRVVMVPPGAEGGG